jgi:K+-sensing histidine kinase KdpD
MSTTKEDSVSYIKLQQCKNMKKTYQRESTQVLLTPHQIYTPLTTIKGYVSMIREGTCGSIPKEIKQILDIVEQSATKLINTVQTEITKQTEKK